MAYITITDEFGRKVDVDDSTQKLDSYNNKLGRAVYNAEIIENGKTTGFWTNYTVSAIIEELEPRLRVFGSPVNVQYAEMVQYHASENDPDGKIWNKILTYVKEHESEFFDDNGDFKKNIPDIRELF